MILICMYKMIYLFNTNKIFILIAKMILINYFKIIILKWYYIINYLINIYSYYYINYKLMNLMILFIKIIMLYFK